ncbi:DNA-binding GntR family transcriptional regulator [Rhizobium sp. BK650]|uniref:GntR family transcriptional regulator n=1 Tax=Rhizobium sp. BK650 TaxID=2586990 RepID=UPI001611B97E|nr:GntR family transcriptional regulator [Rhizobium sp. BK650]MBB3659847.1 DNA-binding GntR family transcriptional regulator [Rhizobium sp. BK650]
MTMANGAEIEAAATAVRSEPIYLTIYQVLRDHLERGALAPGLVLGQANIARAFNVSRIPAGIALGRLLGDGLIHTFEGRGYIVPGGEPLRGDLFAAGLDLPHSLTVPVVNRREQIYPEVEHAVAVCLAYGRFLLNETALAQHYDVSRTIAHEVLTQLERSGVIEQDSNNRWYAGPLSAKVFRHHYDMRRLLEPEALRQAYPFLEKESLEERRQRLVALGPYPQAPERLERVETDLHLDSLSGCPNTVLLAAVRRSQRVLIATHSTFANFRTEEEISAMISEHSRVYDALLADDIEGACVVLANHLRRALDPNLKILERLPAMPAGLTPPYLIQVKSER